MATATVRTANRQRRKFNMGCHTLHQDEIELAKNLHAACVLLYGERRCRQHAARSPSLLFRKMRYGRAIFRDMRRPTLCIVPDSSDFVHCNKAGDRDILKPTSRRWSDFVARVRQIVTQPQGSYEWSATAAALDELGFAIAESIATMMCWGIESDDCVLFHNRADT